VAQGTVISFELAGLVGQGYPGESGNFVKP